MPNTSIALPDEFIEDTILLIRGKRVILDHDLARLYGVATRVLNQAVKRNLDRFPEDFMFQLTDAETEECQHLKRSRSQIVILKKARGTNIKYQPCAFTEHGILMLSSVLKSQRAVQVNIQIMRTFVRLREMLASNETLIERLHKLEENYDAKFKIVFSAIRQLMNPRADKRKPIGFHPSCLKLSNSYVLKMICQSLNYCVILCEDTPIGTIRCFNSNFIPIKFLSAISSKNASRSRLLKPRARLDLLSR